MPSGVSKSVPNTATCGRLPSAASPATLIRCVAPAVDWPVRPWLLASLLGGAGLLVWLATVAAFTLGGPGGDVIFGGHVAGFESKYFVPQSDAEAARFLQTLAGLIERPSGLAA